MLPEIILDLLLGDAISSHDLRVFDAESNERRAAAEAADIKMAYAVVHLYNFCQRRERLLATIARSVNRQETVDAENRHRTVIRFETHLDVIRLPRAFLLIFAEAHGVLARPTEGRTVGVTRITFADGDEYQSDCPSDSRVGPKARAEHPRIAIDVERGPDRTIEKQRGTDVTGRRLNAVQVETGFANRFHSGDNHRQVFRQASSHDGVD